MKLRESGMAVQQRCRSYLFSRWTRARPFFLVHETGSELVEFGLLILPLMAMVFLIMDIAWVCFAQGSLQYAVQSGVRSAITSYVPTGTGQDAYIKSVVQKNAGGFLRGSAGLNMITINYYSTTNLNKALVGSGSNAGGNIIEIVVQGAPVSLFGPVLLKAATSVLLTAKSSDVMESSPDPNGLPPTR